MRWHRIMCVRVMRKQFPYFGWVGEKTEMAEHTQPRAPPVGVRCSEPIHLSSFPTERLALAPPGGLLELLRGDDGLLEESAVGLEDLEKRGARVSCLTEDRVCQTLFDTIQRSGEGG